MHKINTVFSNSNALNNFNQNIKAHQLLQQFWLAAAPKIIAENSFASSLINGQLLVLADSALVTNKIKLTQASLLTQLQNLQLSTQAFRECKVTAITVKVQVKSRPKAVIKAPRVLSRRASNSLKQFANDLGDSPLANKLQALASKGER
jgi:Dna[CI] antecedent, DciA